MNNYQDYVAHLQKLADVEFSIGVLSWDKEVNLPDQGAAFRSRQVATLSGIAHDIFTDKKLGDLLEKLQEDGTSLTTRERKNIEETYREYQKVKKLDTDFVIRRSQLISEAYHAWIKARQANDFNLFKTPLSKVVAIKREETEILGYQDHPYNALLDEFEPGAKTKDLDALFADVKEQLVAFVRQIRSKDQVDNSFLHQHFPDQKQWDFGIEILKKIGYDFSAGRQDRSPHPFTVNFSSQDVRITTRVDEKNFGSMTWSCIHEGGHALYEQGLPAEQYGLPLGKYISLGIHESQSRLWENNVGRSKSFWKAQYPLVLEYFPDQMKKVSLDAFYTGINQIEPSLIRVESDELHYHFHILIRYEIEKALIEGNLSVADLPQAWAEKYKAYLDLEIPDDNHGVLQDIHWAHGSFGYFPTYSLGSFYAAQFFHQATLDLPNLNEEMEQGNTSSLLVWLREKVHQHGRFYTAEELCKEITGEALNFKYFMAYAKKKFGGIYGV